MTVVLVSTAAGITINVASNSMTGWLSSPWLLWPLLAAVCALSIGLDVIHGRRAQGDREPGSPYPTDRVAAHASPAPPPRRSDTVLVDSSVDDHLQVAGVWTHCAALDFKFVNRGTVSSVLHHFDVEVISFEPDSTPVLAFSHERSGPRGLGVTVSNVGWGAARDCEVRITDPVLARLLPSEGLAAVADIDSGERREVLTVPLDRIDQEEFDELTTRRGSLRERVVTAMEARQPAVTDLDDFGMLLSHHERWHVQEYFSDLSRGPDDARQRWHIRFMSQIETRQLPVRLTLDVAYRTATEARVRREAVALTPLDRPAEGELWIVVDRFRYDPHQVMFAPLTPSEAVVAVLDPETETRRGYPISRTIPPGEPDRFHVVITARRSGTYTVRVRFHTDADPVVSPPLSVYLRRDRNQGLPEERLDGASFAVDDDRLVRSADRLVLRPPKRH
ncbi:hypothetical protein [Plantactinospora sp. B5E13]|uniref:hypothetical protein n=1 Tax=Plantactinospora sp. B5E13 TaxID=3153758 RepID=UPI00325D507B